MESFLFIAETEDGSYQPVAEVTESEAHDCAAEDFANRDPNEDLCPCHYALWSRDHRGRYVIREIIDLDDLAHLKPLPL
jgi:hypothetical protein